MIKGILFDLDGTLCNTLVDLAAATNRVITAHGFEAKPVENFKTYVGNGAVMQLKRAIGVLVEEELFSQIHKEYIADYGRHYMDATCAYDGVAETVAALYQKGIKMAVVTNKPQAMATNIVKEILGEQIPVVFGNTPDFPLKPDPTLPLHVADLLNIKPEEILFVGDSGVDMQTGVNMGATSVGVTWGFRSQQELLDGGAKYIVNHPAELLALL